MFRSLFFFLGCIAIATLFIYTYANGGIPLWYDYGAYRHLIQLLSDGKSIGSLPLYVQRQFEPFSGTFFYTLSAWLWSDSLFSWWYLWIYILSATGLFLLGKKKDVYTIGSYIAFFLFLFSVLQYVNFWWSFGKQMFATFFLVLLMRYHKKTIIGLIFLTACIALHRLTGFIAILFILWNFLSQKSYKKWLIIMSIWLAIATYYPTFHLQVSPYLWRGVKQYIFLPESYGTGLQWITFWLYELPLIILAIVVWWGRRKKLYYRAFILPACFIIFMVVFRCIAHTRLESFMDLFVIIFILKNITQNHRKILIIFALVQLTLWFWFVSKWHTSFIGRDENSLIQKIVQTMPKDVQMVTLSSKYMSMMTWYTSREIYSQNFGIWANTFSKKERESMHYDHDTLCKKLSYIPGNVVLYVWVKEAPLSTQNNVCLREIKRWKNGAQIFYFERHK